jgi:hypothetical protein
MPTSPSTGRSDAWSGSTRSSRLPADWERVKKPEARRRNPRQVCHWCGLPGGDELDHIVPGDDHRQENLDWIHGRRAYLAGRSARNCHGEKTAAEGNAARPRRNRPEPPHAAFR